MCAIWLNWMADLAQDQAGAGQNEKKACFPEGVYLGERILKIPLNSRKTLWVTVVSPGESMLLEIQFFGYDCRTPLNPVEVIAVSCYNLIHSQ